MFFERSLLMLTKAAFIFIKNTDMLICSSWNISSYYQSAV